MCYGERMGHKKRRRKDGRAAAEEKKKYGRVQIYSLQ